MGATGATFVWAKVQTYGAVIDLVADPVLLDRRVVTGGVIRGSFWLSGRIAA